MKIYGRPRNDAYENIIKSNDEDEQFLEQIEKNEEPINLREVTFVCLPNDLRELSIFFNNMADEMDSFKEKFGHEHLIDYSRQIFDCDVIIVNENIQK